MENNFEELFESLEDENVEKDMKIINQAFSLFKGWPIWKLEAALDTIKFMAFNEFMKSNKE